MVERRLRGPARVLGFWRRAVDVVVFAGTKKESGLPVDSGVVIAAEGEAILEGDALGGVGGQRENRKGG